MKKETDINKVKEQSKLLLYAVSIEPDHYGIVRHPYIQSTHAYIKEKGLIDITIEENYNLWIKTMVDAIDTHSIQQIFDIMITTPWKLTWLKFAKPYLSKKDFSNLLGIGWVTEDNPNMDVNVSTATAIKWFKNVDKEVLMNAEELAYWKALPDEVTLYRGVSKGRKKYGISWTDNKDTAIWFKNRFLTDTSKGCLLKVVAPKEHCLCYLNRRNEKEIVLDVKAVKNIIEEIK